MNTRHCQGGCARPHHFTALPAFFFERPAWHFSWRGFSKRVGIGGAAVVRGALALLPIIAWQTYMARVRASDEYAHPAYEYQRTSYQYYNVSYADNVRLLVHFVPNWGEWDSAIATSGNQSPERARISGRV
jgi:hypothetical protein